jgi:carboxypeptidase D
MVVTLSGCGASESGLTESASKTDGGKSWQYVRVDRAYYQEHLALSAFVRDHGENKDYVLGYLPNSITVDDKYVVALDERLVRHGALQPFTLEQTETLASLNEKDLTHGYHNYVELTAELEAIASAYPQLTTLSSIGTSVEDRNLWMMRIASDADINKPKLLYIGNMHGDEVVGREMMLALVRELTSRYSTDNRIAALVNNSQIYIIPSMNPDGFEAEQRWNGNGSDLNRNFPDFTSDPRDVPTGRQVETQAIMSLHDEHHFISALNFHGGEICFNMPWDTKPNRTASDKFGDDAIMNLLGRQYADLNPSMRTNSGGSFDRGLTYGYEWYEVNGGMQDWSIHYRNSTHATIELSVAKWPQASQLPTFWQENREALLTYLEQSLVGYHLQVVDAETNEPVEGVTVTHNGTPRAQTFATAFVHRLAPMTATQVTITKEGYATKTLALAPNAFSGSYVEVALEQEASR